MAKLMSKSELVQKIAERHSNKMTRKDVKDVIKVARRGRLQRAQKNGSLLCSRVRQICCYQEACHKGAERHQSVHKAADNIQGKAGSEDHQGSAGKGRQGCCIVASETLIEFNVAGHVAPSFGMAGNMPAHLDCHHAPRGPGCLHQAPSRSASSARELCALPRSQICRIGN